MSAPRMRQEFRIATVGLARSRERRLAPSAQ
jgi:hypothetical protein